MALDFQGDLLSFFVPHGGGHILARVDDLIVSLVDIKARLLHLHAEFTHHLRRLGLVLIRLHLPLDFVWVEVPRLISLSEGVMVSDSCTIVSEATKVAFGPLLLLDGDGDDFDLVVGEADLNFELVGHDEFVSFNRVVVVLLLLLHLIAFLAHHLLLHLLLLELL